MKGLGWWTDGQTNRVIPMYCFGSTMTIKADTVNILETNRNGSLEVVTLSNLPLRSAQFCSHFLWKVATFASII